MDCPVNGDFLSNGFYQLYADDFPQEEIWLWDNDCSVDNQHFTFETNESFKISENLISYSAYNNHFSVGDQNNLVQDANKNYIDMNVWHPLSETEDDEELNELTTTPDDWGLNIENLLFEDYIDGTAEWQSSELPEKTLLCNDSCNVFLKESTESLLSNLQSFALNQQVVTEDLYASHSNGQLKFTAPADELSFICSFENCNRVYAKSAHLKAHLRRHIGEKPYVCTWPDCTWKFSRSDELARHRRSHSGIKPYKCIYCTKCFSRSDHLTKHRKVHERKMAAAFNKMKTNSTAGAVSWTQLAPGRPGRRPKNFKC